MTLIKLIQNELIKVFGRISGKIALALLLVIAIGAPLFLKTMLPDQSTEEVDNEKTYNEAKENYEAADPTSVIKQSYKTYMELTRFVIDNNIDIQGWKSGIYWDLRESYNTESVLELIDQGKSPEETINAFSSINVQYWGDDSFYFLKEVETKPDNSRDYTISNSADGARRYYEEIPFKMQDISLYKEIAKAATEKYKKLILADKATYADIMINDTNKKMAALKSDIKALEAEYQKDSSKMNEYYTAQNKLYAYNILKKAYEKFKTCSPKNEDWIFEAIRTLNENFISSDSYPAIYAPHDKEHFKEPNGAYDFKISMGGNKLITLKSYEDYLSFMRDKRQDFYAAADTLLYSIGHEIPNDYTRTQEIYLKESLQQIITADLYLVMFFCIFLASIIMSAEYQSGSVRLLMIRPIARWKILLSKLLTVVIFCIGLLTVTFSLTFITYLISLGGEVFDIPYLVYDGTYVKEVSTVLYMVKNALIDSTSMFVAVILAFFLSLLIKNGIVSMALGIGIFAFGQLLAKAALYVGGFVDIMRYTLFPYLMNMQNIRYNPLDHLMNLDVYFSDGGYTLPTGFIIIGIHTVLFAALSFIIFKKQQIKS